MKNEFKLGLRKTELRVGGLEKNCGISYFRIEQYFSYLFKLISYVEYIFSIKVCCAIYGNMGCGVFKRWDTKLERFLPTNQHTQRKFLNIENWTNGEPQ